jgi:hypothetical protein
LDRLLRFLLDGGRAVPGGTIHHQLADLQPDQIAAAELAVDGQIEHRQVTDPLLALEMETDGPDLLGLEGRLGPNKTSLVPRHDRPRVGKRNS